MEARQRAHSPSFAVGLASELEFDYHPYGESYHIIPSGLFKSPGRACVLFNTLILDSGFVIIIFLFTFT